MGGKANGEQKGKGKKVAPTWQETKAVVDSEEDAIEQELREQKEWIAMMRDIDNEEMKKYLSNRPDHLKAKNLEKRGKEEEIVKVPQPVLQPTTQGAQCGWFKEMANNIVAMILLGLLVTFCVIIYVMLKYVAEEPEL